jgi:hypothetical protein
VPLCAIAATNGDAALFDQLQKVYETSTNPEMQVRALYRWRCSKTPQLEKRALDYTLSGKVRNQDSPRMLAIPLRTSRYPRCRLAICPAELGQGERRR